MPYSAISHTSERNKHSEKIFSQFAFAVCITSRENRQKQNNKKQNSVKHQDYNKVTFLQFSAYKANNKPLFAYLTHKINKKKINLAKTDQNDLILWR